MVHKKNMTNIQNLPEDVVVHEEIYDIHQDVSNQGRRASGLSPKFLCYNSGDASSYYWQTLFKNLVKVESQVHIKLYPLVTFMWSLYLSTHLSKFSSVNKIIIVVAGTIFYGLLLSGKGKLNNASRHAPPARAARQELREKHVYFTEARLVRVPQMLPYLLSDKFSPACELRRLFHTAFLWLFDLGFFLNLSWERSWFIENFFLWMLSFVKENAVISINAYALIVYPLFGKPLLLLLVLGSPGNLPNLKQHAMQSFA